ncbi:MAG: 6-phosphofructokinase [Candidatus Ancaeobacter aquaticus]|nr:6-phosphofructokinase [Candidatus Ancaeobacter aquaticus]
MNNNKRRIGVLTGGGDCPGLNAVIRAVTKSAITDHDYTVIGIEDGFLGLLEDRTRILNNDDVSGILLAGGTILGTSNTANPFSVPCKKGNKIVKEDHSDRAVKTLKRHSIDALICIGGDGTHAVAHKMAQLGVKVVGVPKTIDNDVYGTDITFGFNSAVSVATDGVDRLHTTAESHHRVMVLEVMGRYAGWIALESGIAGGADIILLPEIPFNLDAVCNKIKERRKHGKRFSLIVVSEGAHPKGKSLTVKKVIKGSPDPLRLGGIGQKIADDIEKKIRIETRVTVLGHLQRGGTPTPFDRVLATRFGVEAVQLIAKGSYGRMVAYKNDDIISVPIHKVVSKLKVVPKSSSIIKAARAVGTTFGDR